MAIRNAISNFSNYRECLVQIFVARVIAYLLVALDSDGYDLNCAITISSLDVTTEIAPLSS